MTVYVGGHELADGKPAYEAVVDLLHKRGVAGATVPLGVDGTARGERQRARFFGADARVPLMVYAGEQARTDGRPLHHQLIVALRSARASGMTSLRGIWGYHGDQPPHGDSFWQLRRRVPIVSVIVDTPARIRRWFDVVDLRTGLDWSPPRSSPPSAQPDQP